MSKILNSIDVNDYGLQAMKSEGGGQPAINLDAELLAQDNVIASQEAKIAELQQAIKSKASGGGIPILYDGIKFNSSQDCTNFDWLEKVDTSNITDASNMFNYSYSFATIPFFDTSNVTKMNSMFANCWALVNVPVFNTSKVTTFAQMFQSCRKLSDESLNNIMQMAINATSYTGTKTLKSIGVDSSLFSRCRNLSNWSAFVNAGWTTE